MIYGLFKKTVSWGTLTPNHPKLKIFNFQKIKNLKSLEPFENCSYGMIWESIMIN